MKKVIGIVQVHMRLDLALEMEEGRSQSRLIQSEYLWLFSGILT